MLGVLTLGPVQADWFRNSEQQALDRLADGDYEAAASGLSDGFRRGVALYRAERYADAEVAFAAVDREAVRTEARYNLGNARFQQGDYAGAIAAYEDALRNQPNHADAGHNLTLARGLLARMEQEAFARGEKPKPKADEQTAEEQQDDKQQGEKPQDEQKPQDQKQQGDQKEQDQKQQDQKQQGGQKEQDQKQQGDQKQQDQQQQGDQKQQDQQQQGDQKQQDQQQQGDQKQQDQQQQGDEQQDQQQPSQQQDQQQGASQASEEGQSDGDAKDTAGAREDKTQDQGRRGDETDEQPRAGDQPDEQRDLAGERGDETPEDDVKGGEREAEQDTDGKAPDPTRERAPEENDNRGGDAPKDAEGKGKAPDQDRLSPGAGGDEPDTEQAGEARRPPKADQPDGEGDDTPNGQQPGEDAGKQAAEAATEARDREAPGDREDPRRAGNRGRSGQEQAPDFSDAGRTEAVERFDQQGEQPWAGLDPSQAELSSAPTLGGDPMFGLGMGLLEQRLEQVEGDPSMLLQNQFRLEEMRQLRKSGGPLQESRPW